MPEVDPVILQLKADLRDYQVRLTNAERFADQKLGGIEKRAGAMSTSMGRSFGAAGASVARLLGPLTGLAGAAAFLRITDAAKSMEAQLRLATKEFGSFQQAQEDTRRIAATTRSDLESTSALYGNFMRTAGQLGITQAEAARATETVSKAFTISGASAAEASMGIRQLVQGLQSGVLRGDEFNSIMEQAPRLAELFAKALGVGRGELRGMAEDGKLTAAALTNALTNQEFTKDIDEEFKQLPVTFGQAMQQVENAAIITFGAFDRGGQFSTALANFVTDGATGFADLETAALDFGISTRAEIDGLTAAFGPLISQVTELLGLLDSAPSNRGMFDTINGELDAIARASNRVLDFTDPFGTRPRADTGRQARYRENREESYARGANAAGRTPGSAARLFYESILQQVRPQPTASRPAPSGGGGGGRRKTGSGPSAETIARREEQERLRDIRDQASKRRDDFRLDDELRAARAATLTAAEDVLNFQLADLDSQRAQRLDDLKTQMALGELSEEEATARRAVIEEIINSGKQRALLTKIEADMALRAAAAQDSIRTEEAEAGIARSRKERARLSARILEHTYAEEESALRIQAANGEIANLDEALANLKRRKLVDEEIARREGLGPGGRYLEDLQTEAENLGDAYEDIAVRGLERMNSQLSDAVKNGLGLHGVLGDIIGDFIELAIRQQILGPLASAMFGGGGGGGLLGGLFGGGGGADPGGALGLSSLIGGRRRAGGGAVSAGGTYLVGEDGPEVLHMGGRSGLVVPNSMIGASANSRPVQNITIKVDASGALLAGQVEQMVQRGMQYATQVATVAGGAEGERRVMRRGRRQLPG